MDATPDTLSRHFASSADLRARVREISGGRVLLSFSTGKDAIAAWLALRDDGFEVVPFYLYSVPGLGFVEESLTYYERFFRVRIHRFPQPSLYRKLRAAVFQPPGDLGALDAAGVPRCLRDALDSDIRQSLALPSGWIATGVRATDSPARFAALKHHGTLNPKTRKFFAVYDWKLGEVVGAIEKAGVKLPVDYQLFGRTFDGIDARFLGPIRERFPEDYRRILEFFPLADLELFRRDLRK